MSANNRVGQALTAPNIAAMSLLHLSELAEGAECWVESVQDVFVLRKASGATADGITVVAPVAGSPAAGNASARWIRRVVSGAQRWMDQTAWFIDPTSGNDENVGSTSGTAIKTHAELVRRVGRNTITHTVEISLLGNIPTTDPMYVSWQLGLLGFVRYTGTRTTLRTGAITAKTDLNAAGNQPAEITSAAILVGDVGQRVRLTGGTQPNATAWIAKSLGANAFRVSSWIIPPYGAAPPVDIGSQANVNVAVTDPFVVETLSTVAQCIVDVNSPWVYNGAGIGRLVFQDISFLPVDAEPLNIHNNGWRDTILFIGCDVGQITPTGGCGVTCFDCKLIASDLEAGMQMWVTAGMLDAFVIQIQANCSLNVRRAVIGQGGGGGGGMNVAGTLFVAGGGLGMFDGPASGMRVLPGGIVTGSGASGGAQLIFGSGNTTKGMIVNSGGFVIYATKPIVTGATGDAQVGGVAHAWATIPSVTALNNAMIVAEA